MWYCRVVSRKFKIICSDLHLGTGVFEPDGSINILEDFHKDKAFEEFLNHYSSGEFYDAEVDLILNGDIFDGLKVPFEKYHSPILTEAISLKKFKQIIDGHPVWFDALRDFAAKENHKISYVVGNHDVEMLWESCQAEFKERVEHPINFYEYEYNFDGVHVEHGHQHEAINALNPKKVFLSQGLKEPIINLPWGSHFVINFIIPIKKERPVIDKIRPVNAFIRWGMLHDTFWTIKTILKTLTYFLGTRFSKSLYRTSNLVTTFKILKELQAYQGMWKKARKVLDKRPEFHTVIFGHSHNAVYKRFDDSKEYLNSGTWTEVVNLNLDRLGKSVRMTYILIDYQKDLTRPRGYLKEWKGRWHEDVESFMA